MFGSHQSVGIRPISFFTVLGFSLLVIAGCDHPLPIEGSGDSVSMSGNRDCSLEEQPCQNLVINDYQETYSAVARDTSTFVRWEGCPNKELSTQASCAFNVPADVVHK